MIPVVFQSKRLQLAADNSASIPLPDVQVAVGRVIINAAWTIKLAFGRQWKWVCWKILATHHQNSVVALVRYEHSACLIHCNCTWLIHVSCVAAITLDKLTIRANDWKLVRWTVMDYGVMVIRQLDSVHWSWDACRLKIDLSDCNSVGRVFVQCVSAAHSDKKVVWTRHWQTMWTAINRPRRQRVVLAKCNFVYAIYVMDRSI